MLAKIWKKLLLAICMIACLYNIMHKLIGRISLEAQLNSVQNQNSIIDMLENPTTNTTNQEEKDSSAKEENTKKNTTVVIM